MDSTTSVASLSRGSPLSLQDKYSFTLPFSFSLLPHPLSSVWSLVSYSPSFIPLRQMNLFCPKNLVFVYPGLMSVLLPLNSQELWRQEAKETLPSISCVCQVFCHSNKTSNKYTSRCRLWAVCLDPDCSILDQVAPRKWQSCQALGKAFF